MLKALVALDGSATSQQALCLARDVLAGKEVAITVLHVIPQHLVYGRTGVAPIEVYNMAAERALSDALLDESAAFLRDSEIGPQIEKRLGVGDPADLILSIAAELDADLIILGSRGLSAPERFLIGSVSTKVVTQAHCAVMVVHPKSTAKPKPAARSGRAAGRGWGRSTRPRNET